MKPGKARKDRPKGAKSFTRGSNKRVERSAVARPEKRDNRRDDKGETLGTLWSILTRFTWFH